MDKHQDKPGLLGTSLRVIMFSRVMSLHDWAQGLTAQGIEVAVTGDWEQLLAWFEPGAGQALVVAQDSMAVDSFSICRAIRALDTSVPLILICREVSELDEVLGLELGADDVLAQSAPPRVLAARLRAVSRRARNERPAKTLAETLAFGQLEIRRMERAVYLRGKRVALSAGEFDLLLLLASRAGEVVSHGEILKQLRGLHLGAEDRSIDARLYRLRRRFGNTEDIKHRLRSVRPNGYMFSNMAWS